MKLCLFATRLPVTFLDWNMTQKRSNYIELMTLSSISRANRNRLWGSQVVDKKTWLLTTISNTHYCFSELHKQNEKRNFWLWLILKHLFNFSFEYSKTYKVPHKIWQFWIHQSLQWLRGLVTNHEWIETIQNQAFFRALF